METLSRSFRLEMVLKRRYALSFIRWEGRLLIVKQYQVNSNVGTIEEGIKSAAWSPDDELLVLVTGKYTRCHIQNCATEQHISTGDDKLIEMTKDFEVLSEGPLSSAAFGEGMISMYIPVFDPTDTHSSRRRTGQRRLGREIDSIPWFSWKDCSHA